MMAGKDGTSQFFCQGTLGYFFCAGESEARFGGFSKKMARARLLYLIETGRICPDQRSILTDQICRSELPDERKGVNSIQL